MTLPDFTALSLSQIAGYLLPLAALVFLTGVSKALTSSTVLWTYVGAWITDWLAKGLLLLAIAAVGKGVAGLLEPNDLVGTLIFVPAVATYVVAAFAAIAKNVGVDLGKLPFARNTATVFGPTAVRRSAPPAITFTYEPPER